MQGVDYCTIKNARNKKKTIDYTGEPQLASLPNYVYLNLRCIVCLN